MGARRTTYRISAAARELGISVEWLRAGERRGVFPPARRGRNGHRHYTPEDMELIRKIYDSFGHDDFSWQDVLALLAKHPEWSEINRGVAQKVI